MHIPRIWLIYIFFLHYACSDQAESNDVGGEGDTEVAVIRSRNVTVG